MHTQHPQANAIVVVPDFAPDEYARFDANDHAAEQATTFASAACSDAGPCPSDPVLVVELGEPPF
jgi:hypothetical protein